MLSEGLKSRIMKDAWNYPERHSAVLPALHAVQAEDGYLTTSSMAEVADILHLPFSDVEGVATFYSMFFKRPVGKYVIDVCTTLSCSLLGAQHIVDYLSEKLGIQVGETTPDGLFTLRTVECLGDCGQAPIIMVDDIYYEAMTPEKIDNLLNDLRSAAQERQDANTL